MRSLDDVAILEDFREVVRQSRHTPVPGDWFLLLTDVRGSTRAIDGGRYKEVNVVGASSIIAVLNAVGKAHAAFVFGGDGATILVPPHARDRAVEALVATRDLARREFSLDLRVGAVPVGALLREGHTLKVTRYRLSPTQLQTMLSGDGVAAAEQWVKDPAPDNPYLIGDFPGEARADYTGLECRWEPVPARRGEIVSLLVSCPAEDGERVERVYDHVLNRIDAIYGDSRPVSAGRLKLARAFARYETEARVRTFPAGRIPRLLYRVACYLTTRVAGFVWERLRHPFGKRYVGEVVRQTDHRKFDGMLRMVLDGDAEQRRRLEEELTALQERGDVVFGMHVSDTALMTCLVFERLEGEHLHFVDGAQGGYAEAARDLKARLARTGLRAAR